MQIPFAFTFQAAPALEDLLARADAAEADAVFQHIDWCISTGPFDSDDCDCPGSRLDKSYMDPACPDCAGAGVGCCLNADIQPLGSEA